MNQLLLAIILSILPITELRAGLPLAINYALKNNIPILSVFLLVVFSNILIIFFIFFFLDFLHKRFLKLKFYKKIFLIYLRRIRKKTKNFEKKFSVYGFLALTLFVAVPFPSTGAWTGSFIAWFLGLDRKKSIFSIALGVLIAGIITLLVSLGVISLINIF